MNVENITKEEIKNDEYINMRKVINDTFHLDLNYDSNDYLKSIGINILTGEALSLIHI